MERTSSWHAEVEGSFSVHFVSFTFSTVYSGYSGHIYGGQSDIVATFPGTKYIYSIIFTSDIVAGRIWWPEIAGQRWPLYPKCTVHNDDTNM